MSSREKSPTGCSPHAFQELRDLFETPVSGVALDISPADDMFVSSSKHYFEVGQSALRMVKLAMLASGKAPDEIKQVLDLPSGYGRVLRTLRAAFPDAEITACDLERDGVDYCSRAFDAKPVYSQEYIGAVSLETRFDLIWCGSLLTHLDAPRWDEFIAFFVAHLNPDGLLLFTVHGPSVLERIQNGQTYGLDAEGQQSLVTSTQEVGFGYANYPDQQAYGISIAARDWTMKCLAKHPELRILTYCDRGWNDHQDVVVCSLDINMRVSFPEDFDLKAYKSLNPDLTELTDLELKNHYLYHGFKEKRKYRIEPPHGETLMP